MADRAAVDLVVEAEVVEVAEAADLVPVDSVVVAVAVLRGWAADRVRATNTR